MRTTPTVLDMYAAKVMAVELARRGDYEVTDDILEVIVTKSFRIAEAMVKHSNKLLELSNK